MKAANHRIHIMIMWGWPLAPAAAQNAKFYALFMAKFTDNIQWPNTRDQVVIGVYGDQDIVTELQKYDDNKKNIAIIKISSVNDVQKSHLVFIGESKNSEFESIHSSADGNNMILVRDNGTFIRWS